MHHIPFDLTGYYESIRRLSSLEYVEVAVAASVSAEIETETMPVFLLRVGNPETERRMLVLAGMQGDEVAPLLSVVDFAQTALDINSESLNKVSVDILTPISPYSVLHQSRYTYQGCDVNRDFGSFRTQEARVIRDVLQARSYDLVLSLHESPRDGFFMITEPHNDAALDMSIYSQLAADERIALSNVSLFGLPLRQAGLSPKPSWLMQLQHIFGVETLGYYTNTRGINLITAESDWKLSSIEQRSYPHYASMVAAVEALTN